MKNTVLTGAFVLDSETRTFKRNDILISDGIIEKVATDVISSDAEIIDVKGKYIIPGLIDMHTHGRAGCDFNRTERMDYNKMLSSYAYAGTTSVMATLASDEYDSLITSLKSINSIRSAPPVHGNSRILGIHLEGRYLNPLKRGAHGESLLALPTQKELCEISDCAMPLPFHISLAPELEGGLDFIRRGRELGITFGIAHSDATAEKSKEALDAGVSSFTHLYNAMRPLHHREPGNTGVALISNAYAEVICDGLHIHPDMVKLAYLAKDKSKIILITDSMEATDNGDGDYYLAGMFVTVKDGRALTSDGAIAGSLLSLFDGVTNLCRFAGADYADAVLCASKNPAELLGVYDRIGSIDAGKAADLLIIDSAEVTENSAPVLEKVCIGGIFVR